MLRGRGSGLGVGGAGVSQLEGVPLIPRYNAHITFPTLTSHPPTTHLPPTAPRTFLVLLANLIDISQFLTPTPPPRQLVSGHRGVARHLPTLQSHLRERLETLKYLCIYVPEFVCIYHFMCIVNSYVSVDLCVSINFGVSKFECIVLVCLFAYV